MDRRIKAGLSILLLSVSFYMMITTRYLTLGDELLKALGVKPWTGENSGTHLTVIYFGVIFMSGLFLVKKHAVYDLKLRGRSVFIIFVITVTIFHLSTGLIITSIKRNSPGLMAIGYNPSKSSFSYRIEENKFVDFNANLELTNYSTEEKAFNLRIYNSFFKDAGLGELGFYNPDGSQAVFQLKGKETKSFILDLDNYDVWVEFLMHNSSGSGEIEEVVLIREGENRVRLSNKNVFAIELNR